MAGDDVEPGAVEREQMRREGDFDGRKGRRLVFRARKAHAGRGRRSNVNGGSASTKASYCSHSSPSDWLSGAPSTVMSATGSAK
jgi:hypothetical protein